MKPYVDQLNLFNSRFVRTFDQVNSDELIWHRDKRDRIVKVKDGEGWKIQFDNELPKELKVGSYFKIEKEVYHRLLKGKDQLILEIEEL